MGAFSTQNLCPINIWRERERERVRGLTSGGRFKSPPRCDPSRESLPRRISGAINLVVVKILEGALDRPGVKYDSALN